MEQDENKIVELIGEDGAPVRFEHLMTLTHRDRLYILLTPAEPETPDAEGAVVIMRIERDAKDEDCYVIEEDEAVQEAVFEEFLELMEEDTGEDTDM